MTPSSTLSLAPEQMQKAQTLLKRIGDDLRTDRRLAEVGLAQLKTLLTPAPIDTNAGQGMPTWQRRLVLRYIDDNLVGDLACGELADLIGLSRSYFARLFKEAFGESPRAFVIRRRVELAKTLMLGSGEGLCEIALASGFSDQSHMTRQFHRLVGETPSAWRRLQRAQRALISLSESLAA